MSKLYYATRTERIRIDIAKKILPSGYHVSKNNPKGKVRKPKEVKAYNVSMEN